MQSSIPDTRGQSYKQKKKTKKKTLHNTDFA